MPLGPITAALLPLGYLLAALLGAGLLAYPLYRVLHDAMSLRAVVSRLTLALIVLSLPWLIAKLRLGHGGLGLPARTAAWIPGMAAGLSAGAAVMALLVLMEAALGVRVGTWPPGQFAASLLRASTTPLLVGLLVGGIEELLFRGVLLGSLLKRRGVFFAIAVSAFYYAALHFFHSELKPPEDSLNWLSGFAIIGDAFTHLFRWSHLDSFAALFCAGLLLGCLRLLAGAGLSLCIGVHAGWVYVLRTTRSLSDPWEASPWAFLVGDYDHIIGWLATAWLALLTLPLLWALHRRHSRAQKP